jgi:hypothetical protein
MGMDESNTTLCLDCIPNNNINNNENATTKSMLRKKYIRMMKTKPMTEFMKEGGTYEKYCRAMLYHTFLVVMLGSTVLAKSVEEKVR